MKITQSSILLGSHDQNEDDDELVELLKIFVIELGAELVVVRTYALTSPLSGTPCFTTVGTV